MSERIETAGRESMSRETLGLLLGLAGVVIFGGTLPFTKLALTGFEPGLRLLRPRRHRQHRRRHAC